MSALSAIDANNIASISVLKDAASTAQYGARGANGVILITTKSGRSGEANSVLTPISAYKMMPFMAENVKR